MSRYQFSKRGVRRFRVGDMGVVYGALTTNFPLTSER